MPAGLAKIAVETKSAQASRSVDMGIMGGSAPPGGPGGGAVPKGTPIPPEAANTAGAQAPPKAAHAEKIPENYADPESSGLTYAVKSGAQEFNVELK
jgi:hypothetical protein